MESPKKKFSNPTVTLCAFSAIASHIIIDQCNLSQSKFSTAYQDIQPYIPDSIRACCLQNPEQAFKTLLLYLIQIGDQDLAGIIAIAWSAFGFMPTEDVVHCLEQIEAHMGGEPIWLPGGYEPREEVKKFLINDIKEYNKNGLEFQSRLYGPIVTTQPTPMMHTIAKWFLSCISMVLCDVRERHDPTVVKTEKRTPISVGYVAAVEYLHKTVLAKLVGLSDSPADLYAQACEGDATSLRQLLALDPSLVSLPTIRAQLPTLASLSGQQRLSMVFKDQEKLAYVPQKAKVYTMNTIMDFSTRFGGHLDGPKIQRLFNAMTKDFKKNAEAVDGDIGKMSEEHLRQLRRRTLLNRTALFRERDA